MNTIILNSNHIAKNTVISNIFIDSYMPCANGEYVKVYIYLLRCMSDSNCAFGILQIADQLDSTETDIIRALHYWEKEGLVSLKKDGQGQICEITLLELKASKVEPLAEVEELINQQNVFNSEIAATINTEDTLVEEKKVFERPTYTQTQITEILQSDEIESVMAVIENTFLKRPLTQTDVQLIAFLYESLNFHTDLVLFLYEYCASKDKRNTSYIEAVAIAWAEEGIDTVEKADTSIAKYNKSYQAISKAFGLGRQPGQIEKQFIDKWTQTYGFDDNIIVEACNRALLRTGKPDFKYTDGIIENWYKNGVKKYADIAALDNAHSQRKKKQATAAPKAESKPAPKNQFNSFEQRNYSKEYFSDLEKRLLSK